MGKQISWDLSEDINRRGFYGSCWRKFQPETLAANEWTQLGPADSQFDEDNHTYGRYEDGTGVSLFNLRNTSSTTGCLMRKSRVPIDLSVISRIELDVSTSGSTSEAPWYALRLFPAMYGNTMDNAKSAQIDLIENYDFDKTEDGKDMNSLRTGFANCGMKKYTEEYCRTFKWDTAASKVDHHITLQAFPTVDDGRVLRVYRCRQPQGQKLSTCDAGQSGDYAEIKVEKSTPHDVPLEEWFPVWNQSLAKDRFAKYWLVAHIWWTSGTDFQLTTQNVRFFQDNDTEWTMPLNDSPPSFDDLASVVA